MKRMPTVAEQLRAAREAKNLTVQQVADATKIRTDHITALERGDYSVFSAPIYIRGSVKNYATTLKLDLTQIMVALNAELDGTENFSEPPPFTPETNRPLDRLLYLLAKVNLKVVLAALLVLGIIAVVLLVNSVLKHHKSSGSVPDLPPAKYQPANAGDTLPLPKR